MLDGKFDNYQSKIVTFLKCDFCDSVDMKLTVLDTYKVPLSNYYHMRGYPYQKYGVVEELHNEVFYDDYEELRNSMEGLYYIINREEISSEGIKIDKKLGEEMFEKYNKMIRESESIFLVQGEKLPIEEVYESIVNNYNFD